MKIPTTLSELTPSWLTEALRAAEGLADVEVALCEVEPMGVGQGLSSQMGRLRLTYAEGAAGPATMIAKLPPSDAASRATASRLNLFEIENRFYAELAPRAGLRVPRCYYGAMNRPADEHVLLLEDLAGSVVGDDVAGSSLARVELVVRHLAGMHAAWWESPQLAELAWLKSWSDPSEADTMQSLYQTSWDTVEGCGFEIPPAVVDLGRRLRPCSVAIHRELSAPPWTLVHGDVRLDNLLFATAEAAPPLVVIDWQIVGRLRGAYDVATFLVSSLEPEIRGSRELDLVAAYHRALLAGGVANYGLDACLTDYRLAMVSWFSRVIFVGASYDLGNERGHALIQGLLDRVSAALVDLDCGELIGETVR